MSCPSTRTSNFRKRSNSGAFLYRRRSTNSVAELSSFRALRGRTTIRGGECALPWCWNRSPTAIPERRSRESRKAVSVSRRAANRGPTPKATKERPLLASEAKNRRGIGRNRRGSYARRRHGKELPARVRAAPAPAFSYPTASVSAFRDRFGAALPLAPKCERNAGQDVRLVYDLLVPKQLILVIIRCLDDLAHLLDYARDRSPVAVSFSPPVSAARRSRSSALAVTADPEISVPARLASRRIAWLVAEGSS